MKKFSEVGHEKNVANFEDLISRCVGFGAIYNPNLNAIKIANMNTTRTAALAVLATATSMDTAFMNAEDSREFVYKPLKQFATRIMSALKACGASAAVIKDAVTINRKIQGRRAKAIKVVVNANKTVDPNNPPVIEPVHISVSQLSYDSMIEHFSKLIDLLSSVAAYNPNEPELQISGLTTLLANMKATNTAHITATTNAISARIDRNEMLYKKVTGLLDIAQECKDYVKSIFGSKSPKYKEVSAIQFKRLVKL